MRARAIYIKTIPYIVKNRDGKYSKQSIRVMLDNELEHWICLKLCRDNKVYAERMRCLHRGEILRIRDYIMSILAGNKNGITSDMLNNTLKSAINELNIDTKDLYKIDEEEYQEISNSLLCRKRK
ncbi:MAG TPA: hypothetical protein IAC02_07390 [Candidatus Coprovivens excrementavium]|nr:hypothetical protein [Candidatus Coprovivens excrementavium]